MDRGAWRATVHGVAKSQTLPGAIMGDPTHEEVMKKIPDMQGRSGYKGPSRLTSAFTPPCFLPPFLPLFLFALLQILVLPAESSSAPLSLNEDQLKTLINQSPRRWYPMKGPGMKKCFNSNPFAGILACLINVCSHCKNAHDCSKHPKHSTLTKETIFY